MTVDVTMTKELGDILVFVGGLIIVASVVERILGFLFDARPIRGLVTGNGPLRSFKPWIALGLSALIVFIYESDILEVIYPAPETGPTLLGMIVTSLLVAGGSAGLMRVFQDVLGMGKGTRDAKKTLQALEIAGKLKTNRTGSNRTLGLPRFKPGGQTGFSG
tara:strand:+ start:2004 stop:2489 length:486 start_codon:yes stop_codon:yes gene_type:complete